jgi:hypothetical protein
MESEMEDTPLGGGGGRHESLTWQLLWSNLSLAEVSGT